VSWDRKPSRLSAISKRRTVCKLLDGLTIKPPALLEWTGPAAALEAEAPLPDGARRLTSHPLRPALEAAHPAQVRPEQAHWARALSAADRPGLALRARVHLIVHRAVAPLAADRPGPVLRARVHRAADRPPAVPRLTARRAVAPPAADRLPAPKGRADKRGGVAFISPVVIGPGTICNEKAFTEHRGSIHFPCSAMSQELTGIVFEFSGTVQRGVLRQDARSSPPADSFTLLRA